MIIFTGVAGSGKSLQGRLLADERGYPWLSTGEFLRMIVGGEPRRQMLAGKLLSDEDIIEIAEKVFGLIDAKKEFVLDGFPRTLRQAEWVLEYAQRHDTAVSLVVHMVAAKDTVRARLLERGRKDDHEEAIDERFDEYEQSIKPILELFKDKGIPVVDINAERPVDEIHAEVVSVVEQNVKDE